MIAAWNRFWFSRAPAQTLGLIRLFLVATLVSKLVGTWGIYRGWSAFRLELPLPDHYNYGQFAHAVPGFEWLPIPSRDGYRFGERLLLLVSSLFCIGFATRVTGAITALIGVYYLLSSQFNYLHHVNVYVWVLAILAVSPCGDHYSVDSLLRRGWARLRGVPFRPPPARLLVQTRMLMVFISLLYLSTWYAKLDATWYDGTVMELLAKMNWLRGPFSDQIFAVLTPKMLGWITIFTEGLLAVGLWFRSTRRFTAWCGVGMHLGIDAMMNVTTFSYMMIVLYLAFADPECGRNELTLSRERLSHRLFGPFVRLFDWTHRFTLVWSDEPAPLSLTTPGRGCPRGIGAALRVLAALPATFLPGFVVDSVWSGARRLLARRVAGYM